ncbi:MAG: hypothetical protein ACRDQ4_24535, partial [Pseudonocardiaceae bacterium]
ELGNSRVDHKKRDQQARPHQLARLAAGHSRSSQVFPRLCRGPEDVKEVGGGRHSSEDKGDDKGDKDNQGHEDDEDDGEE